MIGNSLRQLSRRSFFTASAKLGGLLALGPAVAGAASAQPPAKKNDREQWIDWLTAVAEPVMEAASRNSLRKSMPVEAVPGRESDRAVCSPLEALGRLLAGLAPWLELESGEASRETVLRTRYRGIAQQAIAAAVDPASPDYMRFGQSGQTLVDSSFLSLALLRAPHQLLESMSGVTRKQLIQALELERKVQPPFSNWLLFAALNEVLLRKLDADWDRLRIDYALHSHFSWYVGDGTYGDGPQYHADFYNSYIIHPYLLAIMDHAGDDHAWQPMREPIMERAVRYAAIQERSISSNGEFPLIGRSLTYRAGAFHLLADMARRGQLPEGLSTGAVRSALPAVQQRTLTPAGTFSPQGWLQIGVAGHQIELAEPYISTGSLYLCSAAWLPLGLPATHPFWSDPAVDWTQKRVWSGGTAGLDHAIEKGFVGRR